MSSALRGSIESLKDPCSHTPHANINLYGLAEAELGERYQTLWQVNKVPIYALLMVNPGNIE